jgi:hypothetical protein
MRVGSASSPAYAAWATLLAQTTARTATHQSSPTGRPVEPASGVTPDPTLGRVSRHTFDIRV